MCVELRAVPVVLEGSLPGAVQTMRKQINKTPLPQKLKFVSNVLSFRNQARFLASKKIKHSDEI